MNDTLIPDRCELTGAGLRQPHDRGCSTNLTVGYYPGEVVVMASDTSLGTVDIALHPDDAQHFMERLQVAIEVARSLAAEPVGSPDTNLNADGDRMSVRPAQAERSAA